MYCLKPITLITISFQGNTGHSHDYQVAVVGGGMAGLAAASSLSEAGFDVVLFEAADYLGKERLLVFIFELLRPTLPYIIITIITVSDTVVIIIIEQKCIRMSNMTNKINNCLMAAMRSTH